MLKTGIAVAAALIFSKAIGIESTFAGVVALIGLKQTTKKTVHYGTTLLFGSILSILIGVVVGNYLGVGPLAFGVGTIIAIAVLVPLRLSEGLILSIVVMYHVLEAIPISLSKFVSFSLNELLIVFIGIVASIIVNIAAPQKFDHQLESSITNSYQAFEQYLSDLANYIRNPQIKKKDNKGYQKLNKELKSLIVKAKLGRENCLHHERFEQHEHYIAKLRLLQKSFSVLDQITTEVSLLSNTNIHTENVAKALDLLAKIQLAPEHATLSTYKRMYTILDNLEEHFEASPLPQTREEFVDRSALYHIFIYSKEYLDLLHALRQQDLKKSNSNKVKFIQLLTPHLGIKK